jgi:hypothetical protein
MRVCIMLNAFNMNHTNACMHHAKCVCECIMINAFMNRVY